MTTERFVRLFAGFLVLLSVGLSVPACPLFVSQKFLWLTAFVGFMLFQSSLTGFCPMEIILKAVGVKPSAEVAD
jgi:hypothetical protein